MQSRNWWQNGALIANKGFISGWQLNEVEVGKIPQIVEKFASTGCNYTQVPVISIGEGCGTNPDGFFFKSATEPNNNPDLLGPLVEEFHKRDIRVIVYFNGHSFVRTFYQKHPEWVMITEEGNPHLSVYGTGVSACPNNREYREWQANVIRDLCCYDIDGVFLDGDIFFAKTCYCDTCKKLFTEKYNRPMPLKSDKKHPDWRYLREFQIDSLTSYVEHLYKALKNERPQAALYCNAGLRSPNWTTGRQNRRLIEVQDILLSEGGFLYGDLNNTPIWRTECENKLCVSQSGGKPVVSGMAIDHKRWNWYQLPMAEPRLMMYSALAAGSHVSSAMSAVRNNEEEVINTIKGVNSFVWKNRQALYPTVSLARVAIVWSNVNADYYSGGSIRRTDFTGPTSSTAPGDLHLEFEGFYDACFRNHVPVDVIDEVSVIDGSLDKYDVVMLPNIACMSDKEMDSIRSYVRNGGTLICTFETSLFNEFGEKRQDFGLSDVFGTKLADSEISGPLFWDYVMPVKRNSIYSDIIGKYIFLPSPKYRLKTNPTAAQSIADCAEIMKGCYDGFPGRSPYGFMYMNNYGKGRCIYFAGTVGQALIEWHFPEYIDIMGKTLSEYSKTVVKMEGAPESVSLNVRKNTETGETIIYLTNMTGSMTRPIRKVCTQYDIRLRTQLKPKNAKAIFSGRDIRVVQSGQETVITLSVLEEFEAIVLEVE